ncbi:MAG: hypothetical protein V5A72_03070 [Candidatus Nanohaloarchaea archaeon]
MSQQLSNDRLNREIIDAKNHGRRSFQHLTNNFYLIKAALRYFSVKKGMSFTSSKISDNFPLPVSVAGSGLKVLEEVGVMDSRTESKNAKRYMPDSVDIERLEELEKILRDNHEINSFEG